VLTCYGGRATWNTKSILGVRKMVITESEVDVIDQEWMSLIMEARQLGLSIEDVRKFLCRVSHEEPSSTY
jgi:hypothetical protein